MKYSSTGGPASRTRVPMAISGWALGLAGVFLLTASACERTKPEVPSKVGITFAGGGVKLYQPSGKDPLPAYQVKTSLALVLEPSPVGEHECNPFAKGTVSISLEQPDGSQALQVEIPLEEPFVTPVWNGFLLSQIPRASLGSNQEPAQPFELPNLPGRWLLKARWMCQSENTDENITQHPFWCFRVSNEVQSLLDMANTLEQEDGILLIHEAVTQTKEPDSRLWLLKKLSIKQGEAGELEASATSALGWMAAALAARFPSEELAALDRLCEIARDSRNFHKAINYFKVVNALAEQLKFQPQRPKSLYQYAFLLNELGRPHEALEAAIDAQIAARRMRMSKLAEHAKELEIEILQALGHYATADRKLDELLAQERPSDAKILANTGWLILLNVAYREIDDEKAASALDWATAAFRDALQKRENEPGFTSASIRTNLAWAELLRGNLEVALTQLRKARAEGNPNDRELSLLLAKLEAEIAQARGTHEAALSMFRQLEIDADAGDPISPEYAGHGAFGQGEELRALGDQEGAVAAYERALDWLEENEAVRSPLYKATVLSLRYKWEARALQALLDQDRSLEALDLAERGVWVRRLSQARAARRHVLTDTERIQALGLENELARLDSTSLRLRRLQRLGGLNAAQAAELERTNQQRKDRWAALEMLASSPPEKDTPPVVSLEDTRAHLPEGGVLLRVASLPGELVVWEVTPTDLHVRRDEHWPKTRVDRDVKAYTDSCRANHPDPEVGRSLSHALLGRYAKTPPAFLTVVATGSLRMLPWSALPLLSESDPSAEAQPGGESHEEGEEPIEHFLVSKTAISLRPCLLAGERTPGPAAPKVLVVADPTRDLAGTRAEGQLVSSLLSGSELLVGDEASRKRILTALETSSSFHFAGHGFTDSEQPYLSHLVLANHEELSLMDIQSRALPGTFVFLNACSGGGVATDGGGLLGLADGFLTAGANEVVASLWDISMSEAGRVAESFYHRRTKQDPTTATSEVLASALRDLASGEDGRPRLPLNQWSAYIVLEAE